MPLISSVIARTLAIVDYFSGYFFDTSVNVGNATNSCYQQTNISATLTPCGQQVLSLIDLILYRTPLSIMPFWVPVLKEVLNGLAAV
jgi:hypothetical protein